ncbi:glycosyltransferase family 4 protein [Schinkia azotoformans]|uniref:glycosyltransferase family 4 protein n=1 Tax=Schinkia azotoformans TaxID=1454 RepID=UPI002E1FFF00|nr:glycosyltransferase family 4 protein [Schinkia azotoformans]
MKVLHINSYYSGSKFYKNLYDKQVEYGLDIDVFVPVSSSFDSSNLMLGEYTNINVNHGKYDRFLFNLKQSKIYKDITKCYEIKNYHIIHAHSLFTNGFVALKLKKNYGVPYIVAVRNTDVNIFFKKIFHLRKIGIKILEEADKLIFLSESYKRIVIEKYIPPYLRMKISNKSVIIPNGIDDFWFENKGVPKSSNDNVKLLYVGVINKNKNITTTIRAIEHLKKRNKNVTFTIVGRVDDNKIFQRIKRLSYVNYIAPMEKEDLIRIYRENDIFVMPSKTETFGLVYAEALSQGLPVIYSKNQGFDGHYKEGEVGFSVLYNSAEEIAEKIQRIYESYESLTKSCIIRAGKFDWDSITKEYIQIYEGIKA